MRLRALNVWEHWADGHPVPDGSLRTVAVILNQQAGLQRQLAAALPDEVHQPMRRPDPAATRNLSASRSAGPELGIER